MFDEEQPSSTPLTKSFFRERQRQKTSTTTILVIFHRWKINPINYKIITILYYRTFFVKIKVENFQEAADVHCLGHILHVLK